MANKLLSAIRSVFKKDDELSPIAPKVSIQNNLIKAIKNNASSFIKSVNDNADDYLKTYKTLRENDVNTVPVQTVARSVLTDYQKPIQETVDKYPILKPIKWGADFISGGAYSPEEQRYFKNRAERKPLDSQDIETARGISQNQMVDFGTSAASLSTTKIPIQNANEFASAVSREFKKKAGEAVEQNITKVLKKLQSKYEVADELLDQLDNNTLVGKNFSIQKIGNNIEFIFDEGFKPIQDIGNAVLKAASDKALKIKTPKPPTIKVSNKVGGFTPIDINTGRKLDIRPTQGNYTPLKITKNKISIGKPRIIQRVGEYTPIGKTTGLPIEKRLLPGDVGTYTPEQAKEIYKKTGVAVDNIKNELPSGDKPIITTDDASKNQDYGIFEGELENIAKSQEQDALYHMSLDEAGNIDSVVEGFMSANPQDSGILDTTWDSILKKAGDVTGINKALDTTSNALREVTKFKFTDQQVDEVSKKLLLARFALIDKPWNTFQAAREAAKNVIGRNLNADELGAVLRKELGSIQSMVDSGASQVKIGEDLLPEKENYTDISKMMGLYEAFEPVHKDIAGMVLYMNKKIDDMVQAGSLTLQQANGLRPVDPKTFIKNMDRYIRTTYSPSIVQKVQSLYEPALSEVFINTSTRFRKLTDAQWGRQYLNAVDNLGIPDTEAIPQELLERVRADEEGAVAELGRWVKEAKGYIYEGDVALRNTINYFAKQIHDIHLLETIGQRPDLFTTDDVVGRQRGWVKVGGDIRFGPLRDVWMPENAAKELKRDLAHVTEDVNGAMEFLKIFANIWKYSQVVLRPASWVRNIMYGTFIQQTHGGNSPFNPLNWKYFAKGIGEFSQGMLSPSNQSKDFKDFVNLGGFSANYADEEITDVLSKLVSESDMKDYKSLVFISDKLTQVFGDNPQKLARAYGYLDSIQKYVMYLNKIDNGYNPQESIVYANKYLNNYAMIPQLFRGLRQGIGAFIYPFISFTVAETPKVVETMVRRPWRYFLPLAAIQGYNLWWKSTHPEEAGAIETQKPYYLKNNPYAMIVGYDKEKGEAQYLDLGLILSQPMRTDLGETAKQTAMTTISPFVFAGGPVQGIATAISGRDMFGREIGGPYGPSAGETILSSVIPGAHLVNTGFDIYDSLAGIPYSNSGQVRKPSDAILRAFGLNIIVGTRDQLEKNVNSVMYELNNLKGQINKALENPDVNENEKQKLIAQYQEAQQKTYDKIAQFLGQQTDADSRVLSGIRSGDTSILPTELQGIQKINSEDVKDSNLLIDELSQKKGGKIKKVKVSKPPTVKMNFTVPKSREEYIGLPSMPNLASTVPYRGKLNFKVQKRKTPKVKVSLPKVRDVRV